MWIVIISNAWANHLEKEIAPEEDYPQAAQFVDPEPLSDRLKDGMTINEILE